MKKDWIFTVENTVCGIRTAGVLIKNNNLLVQRDHSGNEYALPGGHIQIGETLEDALIREFKEETAAKIKCCKMLWSEECFFEWNGRKSHNITFYYLIELCDGLEIPDQGTFVPHRDNPNVVIGWLPIEELPNIIIYPEFLAQEIFHLDAPLKHFVSKS